VRISFDDLGDVVQVRVHDFDQKYRSVLEACFYERSDAGYVRRYPRSARHLDKIMRRYARHAPVMFDQLGYFAPVPWEDGLAWLCSVLASTRVGWWLTGSCAACVRGVPLAPHDIDVMVDARDVDQVAELFQDDLIEPIVDTNGWVTRYFGVVFRHCRIDVASDPSPDLDRPEPTDCGPHAQAHLETVTWRGHVLRVPPLALQIAVNRRRGRWDRVALMEAHLPG
jgi:hypothetical protein